MQARHENRKQYFLEQGLTTRKYVIPYISKFKPINDQTRILEIGCGEGGNLMPFIEIGCKAVGVDLNAQQIERAKYFVKEAKPDGHQTSFISENIYNLNSENIGKFDIIMLRDVIEHIPNQEKFFKHLKTFLQPDSVVFFGFPPWCMPFGGHQQVCSSKILGHLPYYHLLPKSIYKSILKTFGEQEDTIRELMHIKSTGISSHRFLKIVDDNQYKILDKTFYLINPNYEVKFGLKKREQFKVIQSIPYFRDFVTTCIYCIITLDS